jgi:membrane protease YdiL (CAAX protease family)
VAPLGSPGEYWDSFLSLFLLGVGFCWVRRRTGSLWWCIGLHAAFVTGIRILKELSIRDEVNPYKVLVGTYDHFVGDLTTVWLLLIGLGVYAAGRTSPKIDTRSP